MSVETALYPPQLNTTLPAASDWVSEGDDHIRLTKTVIKTTFPNVAGAVSATHAEINHVVGVTSAIQGQIDAKGAIAGQTWTGTHVFPATTTVGPLTPTIQGYLATITSDAQAQINAKASPSGQTWTGAHNFTGATITVPTASAGDSSNAAASTAFVAATAFASALPSQSGNAGKLLRTDGTNASWSVEINTADYAAGDLNALVTSGMYSFSGASNAPAGITTGVVIVSRQGTSMGQVVITGSGSTFSRGATGVGGSPSFSAWKRVGLHADVVVDVAGGAIDCAAGNYFTETVSANRTLAFTNVPAGAYACVVELNHTAGTITLPADSVFSNGSAPTFTPGKRHLLYFQRAQLGTAGWYVSTLPNYAP